MNATSSTGSTATLLMSCFTHSIQRTHAKANQHVRTEYGECVYCGKHHKRVIRWTGRNARSWWEVSDEG